MTSSPGNRSSGASQPGQPEIYGSEYKCDSTRNLFLSCEPKRGWHHLHVTERRTRQDFVHEMGWLTEVAYPEVKMIRVVLDNLNTHRPASLYGTFEPDPSTSEG